MAAVAAEFEERVRFVGVAGRGSVSDMQEFVSDTTTGRIPHVVDADGAVWQRFGVVTQPAFVFVDADGATRTSPGGMDAESLRQAADELLSG